MISPYCADRRNDLSESVGDILIQQTAQTFYGIFNGISGLLHGFEKADVFIDAVLRIACIKQFAAYTVASDLVHLIEDDENLIE